jgi:hypothetical protein
MKLKHSLLRKNKNNQTKLPQINIFNNSISDYIISDNNDEQHNSNFITQPNITNEIILNKSLDKT